MTKILVTGGAGFIGSNVVESALDAGHHILVLDNLLTGKENNIPSGAEFIEGDIRDAETVKKAMQDIDYVIHLAAQASVVISTQNPRLDSSINIEGTINILEQAKQAKVKHVIFSSTGGALYGNVTKLPAPENTPIKPLSPYGISKASAELYCTYYSNFGLPVSILRFANVYGPKQDSKGEAGVIAIFLGNIKENRPLTVYGDGTTTRDYVYVRDVAELMLSILDKPLPYPVNVGTGKETKLEELITTIKKVTNVEPEIKKLPLRPGEVEKISLDITKVKELTGWLPKTSLEQGIAQVWKWINSL